MRRSTHIAATVFVSCLFLAPSALSQSFEDSVLENARKASSMIPGNLPIEVRFQGISKWSDSLSKYVDGASDTPVPWVVGVFQIRFSAGWIMVDAGASKKYLGADGFSDNEFAVVGDALSRAKINVLTHEHYDHAPNLYRSIWADAAGDRAILTAEQVQSITTATSDGLVIPADKSELDRFLVVSYERVLPIAPGVVLVKAAGHSPGSQMIFVTLESGAEILFVGDVVWHLSQLENRSHKGPLSDGFGEDYRALKAQIDWLHMVMQTDTNVVIAHDLAALEAQIANGVMKLGLYLGD